MSRITHLSTSVALLLVALASTASAGTLLVSDSIVAASNRSEKHPHKKTARLIVPAPLDRAELCLYHFNTTSRGDKGKIRARITIQPRGEGPATVFRLRGAIRNNGAVLCQEASALRAGDLVTFDVSFTKMPRLRHSDKHTDVAAMSAAILQDLEPGAFIPGPCPFSVPDLRPTPGTLLTSHVIFEAAQQAEKHPTQVLAGRVVPARLDSADICVDYRNNIARRRQGRISARATIQPLSGDPEAVWTWTIQGSVENNEFILCQAAPALQPGDFVSFDVSFSGMPGLSRSGGTADRATTSVIVSQDLIPEMIFTCPDSIPSETISTADQAAASRLLKATPKTQLWRYTASRPTKWTAIGPKTVVVFGTPNGNVLPETTGYGETIAAAVADYEGKMGALSKGPALTEADVGCLEFLSALDSRPGPTSLRRDSRGPHFFAEFYRRSTGSVVSGPLNSIAEACDFLRANGL